MSSTRFRGRKYRFPEGRITMIAKLVGVSRPTVYRYLLNDMKYCRLSLEKRILLRSLCDDMHNLRILENTIIVSEPNVTSTEGNSNESV